MIYLFKTDAHREMEAMVFVCGHCHFEIEAPARPCQCPDCGKSGRIRAATAEEARMFQSRKLEDVWLNVIPAPAG